jgi:hypothetical protein
MSKARSRLLNTIKAPVLGWINQAVHGGASGALTDPTSDGNYLRRVVSGVGSWLASGGAWFASFFTAANEGAARDALGLGTAAVEDADDGGDDPDPGPAYGTVVLRRPAGSIMIVAQATEPAIQAISNNNRDAVSGHSQSGAGMASTSQNGNYHHTFGSISAIDRVTGGLVFLGASAADNRNAHLKATFQSLPTSDPAVAGELWNDSGTVKISAG